MTAPNNICAIVVTYNRKKYIIRLIERLLSESQKKSFDIIVVDNASTDGTAERLKQQDNITLIQLETNTGGSGGFEAGMKYAYEKNYQWMWLMDDDVLPLPNALEIMLSYAKYAKCIYASKKYSDGSDFLWQGRINRSTMIRKRLYPEKCFREKNFTRVNVGCFEGMLVHRDVVEKTGFPDPEFFMVWDDTFYGMKIAEFFESIYIKEACFEKLISGERVEVGKVKLWAGTPFSRYFYLRNFFIVMRYLKKRKELNLTAYLYLIFELMRLIFVTLIMEANPKGSAVVLRGFLHGMNKDYHSYSEIFFSDK